VPGVGLKQHRAGAFSAVKGLACLGCEARYAFEPMLGGCPACFAAGRAATLDVEYELGPGDAAVLAEPGLGFWDYHRFLPVPDLGAVVTLGEGGSPLVPVEAAASESGAAEVWTKYEAVNPTHSWKDRTNAVAVGTALHFGFDKVLATSTGNHGVSVAAYAARAGTRGMILLPPSAPPLSEQEIRFFGAEIAVISDGNIVPLMAELWRDHGWYISQRNSPGVGGRPFGNPFGLEGYKTMSYEIFHQLGGRAPDAVYVPVAGGDGTWGIYKGFRELHELGVATHVPRIVACQSTSGAPIVNAVDHGLEAVAPVATSSTIALSIVDRQSGEHALQAVRRSGGTAVAVSDAELVDAEDMLRRIGICVEPSSAASLAALRSQARDGAGFDGETVVVIGTGAGIRWPATFEPFRSESRPVPGDLRALQEVVAL
jgi:threonine synthase